MTTAQKRKILQRISELEHDIDELRKCRLEIAASGYASASLTSSGGSKSYTRQSIGQVNEAIANMIDEAKSLRVMLFSSNPATTKKILTIYS